MEHRFHLLLQVHGRHRLRDPIVHSGHPEDSDTFPPAFGMGTALTGGGKYVPDDRRFHSLNRLFFRSCSYCSIVTPSTPHAPLLALTLSNASQTTRFEISNGLT